LQIHIKQSHPAGENQGNGSSVREDAPSRDSSVGESVSMMGKGDGSNSDLSWQASLMVKLEELEERKRTEVARLDMDIAAVRQLLITYQSGKRY